MKGIDKDLDRVFNNWVEYSTNNDEIKEFLHEQHKSYYSFLTYFLMDIIRKK